MCRHIAVALGLAGLAAPAPAQASRPASAPTLTLEHELFLPGGLRHALAWSPDGMLLAAGGECGEVVVLDAETGAMRATIDAADEAIGCVRFSPDGKRIAVLGADLSLWTVGGAALARRPARGETRLDWSPDGSRLVCVLDDCRAAVVRSTDLGVLLRLERPDESGADAVAFSPDGARVAVGDARGITQVFDARSGQVLETLRGTHAVVDLRYLGDGRLLRLRVPGARVDYPGGRAIAGEAGRALDADPRGTRCLLQTSRAVVLLAETGDPVRVEGSAPAALHPDARHWARALSAGIEVWAGDRRLRTLPVPSRLPPREPVLTGDGRFLAALGPDRELIVVEARAGARLALPELGRGRPVPYAGGPSSRS